MTTGAGSAAGASVGEEGVIRLWLIFSIVFERKTKLVKSGPVWGPPSRPDQAGNPASRTFESKAGLFIRS